MLKWHIDEDVMILKRMTHDLQKQTGEYSKLRVSCRSKCAYLSALMDDDHSDSVTSIAAHAIW